MKKYLLIIILFVGAVTWLPAQPLLDRTELEKEQKAIQDELKTIQGMYDKVKGQRTQSLSQLNMLKRKMALQEKYISNINRELRMIDDNIYLGNLQIYRLEKQLDTLKSEYARTIVYAYKNRSNFDYVNFIFSASSFNDALRRIAYLKSYRAYREKQVTTINETQELIAKRQQEQLVRKKQKNETLETRTQERNELANQRKEKDAVVSKLKSQENDLQKQIAAKKKRDREIQNAIAAIIRREIDANKQAEAAKNKAANSNVNNANPTTPAAKPESYLELNAADIALGANFADNKGKLPWPVDNGFVKIPFGMYTIEGTNLRDNNPGLTIGTNVGTPVKVVFDGEVLGIHNYGDGYAIVVKHGKYITSYSNLSAVNVSKGATVKRGQVIGKAGEATDGSGGLVDFMLLIESTNVNPASWLH